MKVKCEVCEIKLRELMIQMYTCRCKRIYCSQHMNDHNCTVKYKTDQSLEKITCNKVEKI